jgi:hypothetical protein
VWKGVCSLFHTTCVVAGIRLHELRTCGSRLRGLWGCKSRQRWRQKGAQNGIYCPGNERCRVETAGIVGFGNQQRDIIRPRVVKNQSETNVVCKVLEVLLNMCQLSLLCTARSSPTPKPFKPPVRLCHLSYRSYPVDKGHINGLVSPQQILLVVYAYYIIIPIGQACQRPIEGQSGQDTYFRQYRSATRTAPIVASSQLGASHPSCLISSCLAKASSCDNDLISTSPTNSLCNEVWRNGTMVHERG